MDIADRNYHLKLQEMCDCYMDTDFPKQLQGMAGQGPSDMDESAIKYLSLAIMHTVTVKAPKLILKRQDDEVTARIKDVEDITLPPPSAAQFAKIVEIIRAILHIDTDKGEMPLALGLRSGNFDLQVKTKRKGNKESLKIKFPAL
ncbi:MAG: hypothetical protein ABFS09_13430 [Thermodesulfobacteriota bacterium]